jgi:hypothetical protein
MKKLLILLLILPIFFACKNIKKKNSNLAKLDSTKVTEYSIQKAKEIYYSLPSPIETAMILENSKVAYSEDYLLPISKEDYYITATKQALNLGIYTADLSYVAIFNQQQKALDYLSACQKLINSLGLTNVIPDSVINLIKNNILDKNELMTIISDQFMNINAYLDDNNRTITTINMIYGGWIEGLYLSIKLLGGNIKSNLDLAQIIYDQRLSLEDLIDLVAVYKKNPNLKNMYDNLLSLKSIYDNMDSFIDQKNLKKLEAKVTSIRNKITSSNN